MEQKEIQLLIYAFSGLLFVISIFFVFLILYIQRKKIEYLLEKERSENNFLELLSAAKNEISERNLQYVSWELHDNIGQILSAASIHLQLLTEKNVIDPKDLKEGISLVSSAILEVRSLSKSLNQEQMHYQGFTYMLENEIARINRMKLAEIHSDIPLEINLEKGEELILFRVVQEFFINSIKHAHAKHIFISIKKNINVLNILIKDRGVGFDIEKVERGNGLMNMVSRIKSINGKAILDSTLGKGTSLSIEIPQNEKT